MLENTFNPIRNGTRSKLHWIFSEIQSISTLSLFLGCDPQEFLIEGLQRIFSSNLWEIVGISAVFRRFSAYSYSLHILNANNVMKKSDCMFGCQNSWLFLSFPKTLC